MTVLRAATVTLPVGELLLNSNQRLHWAQRSRVTRNLRETTALAARTQRAPRFPGAVRIIIVVRPKAARPFDPHNYGPSAKAAIDGLVDAHIIPDDNASVVTSVTFVAGDKSPAGWQMVLHIEEATA